MNRTIKEATVKRYQYDNHDQLRTHLADLMAAYNFARRLKTLSGLTPYEYICKIWTSEPDRFNLNPIHQMPGLNTYGTHSMRRTKVTQIYKKTGNLRAVQLLLGHTKMDSTVRYLGVELEDALAISEAIEI